MYDIPNISIHALREESDGTIIMDSPNLQNISIHALREESDDYFVYLLPLRERFQSTLSVRRATIGGGKTKAGTNNFNPRSP